jgi:hypothetical protein
VSTSDRRTPPRRTRSARRPWLRVGAVVIGAVLLLAVGVALGLALGDRPTPGGDQTIVRTLEPLPQQPVP